MGSEANIPDATAVLGTWLHVGSQESVAEERKERLVAAGVTHVLSVMKRPPPWLSSSGPGPMKLPFAHMHVKVEDTRAADISAHFDETGAFIRACEASGGRCVVHCAFGQSRSVTVAAAYMVTHRDMSLGAALEAIRSVRPCACPNPSFMTQLVRHEMATTGAPPSDLRDFPSLPKPWRFVAWRDPLRQNQRFVSCHGRLMKVKQVSRHPRLAVIHNFISKEEAAAIVDVAAPELHPSLVVRHQTAKRGDTAGGDTAVHGEATAGRTSHNCRVSSSHPIVRAAIQRAAYLCGLEPSHAEPAQVVRYLPSQEYKPHHDWFDRAHPESFRAKTEGRGGQRAVTCLAYLVEPERGGRTYFPKLRAGFEPKVGDALLWWNVDENGAEDFKTLHAGEPVEAGAKWALNLWLREKPRRGEEMGEEGNAGTREKEKDAVDELADGIAKFRT